ncbi:hypothetical protein [Alterisphingorhabdus coralli]|uniref:Uncharacterized protein n=1 Tax=Alterisphingorhabdus coralli TaxID=3071408 RepID=A0AA97FBF0_9SPHN|nr:hypothetical protein [Parasphingorhabdus sp. SCSIO 66989]WOE76762.1 hypothetical protein RB602_15360 [Parasphingorhabdus sp. SCSIO 66989]
MATTFDTDQLNVRKTMADIDAALSQASLHRAQQEQVLQEIQLARLTSKEMSENITRIEAEIAQRQMETKTERFKVLFTGIGAVAASIGAAVLLLRYFTTGG